MVMGREKMLEAVEVSIVPPARKVSVLVTPVGPRKGLHTVLDDTVKMSWFWLRGSGGHFPPPRRSWPDPLEAVTCICPGPNVKGPLVPSEQDMLAVNDPV
jgi:hypothetical protein